MLGFLLFQALFSLGLSLDGFDKNCLMETNLLRRRHGVPDITWSEALAGDARAWARSLAQRNTFEHDYNSMKVKSQGENLAFFKPFKAKCQGTKRDDCVECREIVHGWYDEVKNYDFGMGKPKTPGGVVMHFTQEVWKNSRQFGIGTARSNKYGFIAVARYSPRGNRGGPAIFKDNVFPPGTMADPTPSTATTAQPPTPVPPPSAATSAQPPTTAPPTTISTSATAANVTGTPPVENATEPTTVMTTLAAGGSTSPTPLPSATSQSTGLPEKGNTTVAPTTTGPALNKSSKCQYFVINSTTYTYAIVQKCPGKPNITLIPEGSARPKRPTEPPSYERGSGARPKRPTEPPSYEKGSVGPTSPTGPSTSQTGSVRPTSPTGPSNQTGSVRPTSPTGTSTSQTGSVRPTSPTGPSNQTGSARPTSPTGPSTSQTVPTPPPTTPAPNPCEPNPCENGGTCEAEEGNFTCTCPDGYWGPLCQERGPTAEESKDALMLTNMYRAMHQAPEVTWSKEMAAKAQDWADKLAKEQRLMHENENSTDYGENLAEVGSDEKALLRSIDAWYNEVAQYNFEKPTFSTDTGHFSQIVWGATNELGMAKAKTRDKTSVYVVARYKPAGNVANLFESNVKPKQ